MEMMEKLLEIQQAINIPKKNYNKFGNFYYRSAEDILEGVKPLLKKLKLVVLLNDEIVIVGENYYIKATATLIDVESKEQINVQAFAKEDTTKKGMDLPQITGSTSSYARKYALNGLFAINDVSDSDQINDIQEVKKEAQKKEKPEEKPNATMAEIYKLVKKYNYQQEVSQFIKDKFNKTSSKELNDIEAREVLKLLQGIDKKIKEDNKNEQ